MDRLSLKANERTVLGKKVKKLRADGLIPGHVFGNKIETEHVSVSNHDFMLVYATAGETGLIDLKISDEKVRPVLIRDVQLDPVSGKPLNIDFYQVNLKEKVKVPVPIVLIGEEPESVHIGEAVIIQPMSEIEVEALPTDLPEKIEVDISLLKQIDDTILVSQLQMPEGVEILAEPEAVVVKLDSAVTEEMKRLLEEQEAEAAAAAEAQVPEEGAEKAPEVEGEEAPKEEGGVQKQPETEEKPTEEPTKS